MKRLRGLSLTEALDSGRPIRRHMDYSWRENEEKMTFSQEDLRAKDWEIRPAPRKFVLYVSPDGKSCSFDSGSPFDWDRFVLVEEGVS